MKMVFTEVAVQVVWSSNKAKGAGSLIGRCLSASNTEHRSHLLQVLQELVDDEMQVTLHVSVMVSQTSVISAGNVN